MANNISLPSLKERVESSLKKTTITLREYINILDTDGCFVIPDYQRGYVWGQLKKNEDVDSVSYLIGTLMNAFASQTDVFLQGITAHGFPNSYDVCLVDGQQRTTFFYLLLRYLGGKGNFRIKYQIRDISNIFLQELQSEHFEEDEYEDEEYQDIFFFKRTLSLFNRELRGVDKDKFKSFVLDHVKFLFVIIPEEQAKIVFTMMNGNKAKMAQEELIKAEILRCASLHHENIEEAEHASLRGRLAREWDLWLHWWNKEEVVRFFRTDGKQLGWLLPLVLKSTNVSFKDFKEKLLNEQNIKQAKTVFRRIRLIQKNIESCYSKSQLYNYLGVILYIRNNSEQRFSFLRWFFNIDSQLDHCKSELELKRYYDWCIIGVNHEDIVNKRVDKYNDERNIFKKQLSDDLLFLSSYETAYRWLIRQNIKQDNLFNGRTFDFSIENNRSLEHIYPKSKIGHRNDEGIALGWNDERLDDKHIKEIMLWREDMVWDDPETHISVNGTEHCIGNLVLLYGRDNSKFNNADFRTKNKYFFTDMDDDAFKSRHLIHTTMVFSQNGWGESNDEHSWNKQQISRRKAEELKEFENEYPLLKNEDNEL